MYDVINSIVTSVNDFVWGWAMILLLLGTHVFMTIRTKGIQRRVFQGIRLSVTKDPEAEGEVSQFGALTTALAATIGTGNIIGVGTAIALGGPGAVLWCWLTGVFGIATKYSESLISVKYRVKTRDGRMAAPDALIISDPGMFVLAKKAWPDAEIHISTQANSTNYETWNFWWNLGAKRVVSARELSLEEIRQVRERIPEEMEIECFVHGAMCISYSGRCLLSNYFTGRDANRGACTHPCRWKYAVVEETRPGEYLPVYENERGTFLFNSKDLCMIGHIPELLEAGIDSFKIEGRMKTALYVATVARTYRKAIDDCLESEEKYRKNMPWYLEEIARCTYRQFTTGFYFGRPDETTQIYDASTYYSDAIYLGIVYERDEMGRARIEQRNKFCVGDRIEIMKPDGRDIDATVEKIEDEDGREAISAPHPKQVLWLTLSEEIQAGDLLRIKKGGKDTDDE